MSDLGIGTLSIDSKTNSVRLTSMSSGIDTEALTQALYDVKKLPAIRLENKIEVNDAKVAAYQDMRTALTAMQTALDGLRAPPGLSGIEDNLFEQKAAYFSSDTTTAPTSLLGIQASNRAEAGSFDLRIDSLASAHKVMSASFGDAEETLGIASPETLTIALGSGDSADIAVTSDMTVYDLRDAINIEADTTGVKASVLKVDDGDYRLILSGDETGAGAEITLSGAAATTARLDVANPANELSAATDAELHIDNVQVFRPTNTITDLFGGLTVDLYQAEPGTNVTVEIEASFADARAAVLDFVDAYNGFRDFVESQQAVGEDGGVDALAAPLFGDALMRNLSQQIGLEVGSAVQGLPAGSITTLAELGITIDADSKLTVDQAKLDETLLADPDAVRRVFEFNAEVSDPSLVLYGHTNALASSTFQIEKLGDGTWQLTDGTNTIALDEAGGTLKAPDGSAYDGLTLFWTGETDPVAPIDITLSQGIADRLYNTIEDAVEGVGGTIQQTIDEAEAQGDEWRDDVARIEQRAEDYRLVLIEKFARLETALSLSESMLEQIRAQTDAMNGGQ